MRRYHKTFKWILYALGFLLVLLMETSVLGDQTFFGAKLCLVPAYVCCCTCREGHEAGGIFALLCTLFWACSGVTGGPIYLLVLPLSSILSAYACNTWLTRSLLPVMVGCLLSLALCQGGVYLQRMYMGYAMPPDAGRLLLYTLGCSMLPAPLFWWLTKLIERMERAHGA